MESLSSLDLDDAAVPAEEEDEDAQTIPLVETAKPESPVNSKEGLLEACGEPTPSPAAAQPATQAFAAFRKDCVTKVTSTLRQHALRSIGEFLVRWPLPYSPLPCDP